MSMIPKSPENWIAGIEAHHANAMTAIHLPMLTQMQRILGSPEMIPFATIFIVVISAWETGTSVYHDTDIMKMPSSQNIS